jgi:hypothetical protein
MNLPKATRKKLYEAEGKPISISWPLDAPEAHGGKRYAVYSEEDGGKLFTIRLERSKRSPYGTKAMVRIDSDPVRVLPGLAGARLEDGSYETEPERVDEKFEGALVLEASQRNAVLRAEHTGTGKLAEEYAARQAKRLEAA